MTSVADRIRLMMNELSVDQPALGKLAGTSKAMVNHWLSGKVKSISAEFAYSLESKTSYSAQWIQTGRGEKKKNSDSTLLERYKRADPATRALIDLALSDPTVPMPNGLSPSIRSLIESVRSMLAEQLGSGGKDGP